MADNKRYLKLKHAEGTFFDAKTGLKIVHDAIVEVDQIGELTAEFLQGGGLIEVSASEFKAQQAAGKKEK
jgi:hypothetical protein